MKTLFLISVWLIAIPAIHAQSTNPPSAATPRAVTNAPRPKFYPPPTPPAHRTPPAAASHPGQALIDHYERQKTALKKQMADSAAVADDDSKRYSLQSFAGQMTRAGREAYHRRCHERGQRTAALQRQIAALELKQFDLRKMFKLPDPLPGQAVPGQ